MLASTQPLKAEDVYAELESNISQFIKANDLPAVAIHLVNGSRPVWSAGFGALNEQGEQVDENTLFRVGSVTKLFTDIALMQLVEEGLIDLQAPVSTYLPTFSPQNPFDVDITVEMLLTHRSGLVREPPCGSYFDTSEPTLESVVSSVNQTQLVYAPGSKIQYSNAALAVLGRIIEVIRENPFHRVIERFVMKPLDISESHMRAPGLADPEMPIGYMRRYHASRFEAPNFVLGIAPAGSMMASMRDLGKLATALIKHGQGQQGKILEKETLQRMWTPIDSNASARNHQFGLGFILDQHEGELAVSHGGAVYGFATQFKVLPESGIGVAISTNVDFANGAVNRIADYALSYALSLLKGEQKPKFIHTSNIANQVADSLIGSYKSEKSELAIVQRNGQIYLDRINGLSLRLKDSEIGIVIDDLVTFSQDITIESDGLIVFGETFSKVQSQIPNPLPESFRPLIGEYGDDHNILYVFEKGGDLNVIIEWMAQYPLIQLNQTTFAFPDYGLYPNEKLVFLPTKDGKSIQSVSLGGIDFKRRKEASDNKVVDSSSEMTALLSTLLTAAKETQYLQIADVDKHNDLTDITELSDSIKTDIQYASNDNVFGIAVYADSKAYLQRPAANALLEVHKRLEKYDLGLVVFDAYRPWYVTKFFWDATPKDKRIFVANPSIGSHHNRGTAVDLSLFHRSTGQTVEMVSGYDEMSERSYPHYPGGTSIQRWYRDLLIAEMRKSGFIVHEHEWWHFDFGQWHQFPIMNKAFNEL